MQSLVMPDSDFLIEIICFRRFLFPIDSWDLLKSWWRFHCLLQMPGRGFWSKVEQHPLASLDSLILCWKPFLFVMQPSAPHVSLWLRAATSVSFRNRNQLPVFTRWPSSVITVRRERAPLYEQPQDSFMNAIIAQLMLFEGTKNSYAISFWKH